MTSPCGYTQIIDTICEDVLPNMVRLYETQRFDSVLSPDHFIHLIERKVELANGALKQLEPEEQQIYRARIDAAYATSIDRLREEMVPRIRGVR